MTSPDRDASTAHGWENVIRLPELETVTASPAKLGISFCSIRKAMTNLPPQFQCGVATIPISNLVKWSTRQDGTRLFLPPIQRSLVWSNEQIVNFWDSLLRNYPVGTMMVYRASANGSQSQLGRDSNNQTVNDVSPRDFQLFDGQQRLAAILLGFGKGPIESRQLWVDLAKADPPGDLRFALRLNSTGQPFGYRPEAPNQKCHLKDRHDRLTSWAPEQKLRATPEVIFKKLSTVTEPTDQLISAKCAVPLQRVIALLQRDGKSSTETFLKDYKEADAATVFRLVSALEKALEARVVITEIDKTIISCPEAYVRFFGRLGQGGTRLTDDELTYSLMKNEYPHIHDRMQDIVSDPESGRFVSVINLVLAALRISTTLAPWENAQEWEKARRPSPALIERFRGSDTNTQPTEKYFLGLVPKNDNRGLLHQAIKRLRTELAYQPETNNTGLPAMLLARLPHQLLDVLLLFTIKHNVKEWSADERQDFIAFALHWSLFVGNDDKAADRAFVIAGKSNWHFCRKRLCELIVDFESEGLALYAPRNSKQWASLKQEVDNRDYKLARWEERFLAVDREDLDYKPGDALRVLSSNGEKIKRALMWIQREYIYSFNYDPTSSRDEDLPFDLDHVIPNNVFGFDWRHRDKRLTPILQESENFRWQRRDLGNSLGNYRFLEASNNRGRGDYLIEVEEAGRSMNDRINRKQWNTLIQEVGVEKKPWSTEHVATFQRLIDSRTLDLAQTLVNESGIIRLLTLPA